MNRLNLNIKIINLINYLLDLVNNLGGVVIKKSSQIGSIFIFLYRGFFNGIFLLSHITKIVDQIFFIGTKSMFIVCITGTFTGMVLGLQGYHTLVRFGSEGMLGSAVSLSLVREMGPVFTAIMVTARAGSSMAAEIGIMRISEQIDALKTMSIDPIRFLFTPRLYASIICLPLLTSIFDLTGIMGGYLSGSVLLGLDSGIYFNQAKSSVEALDVIGGFTKSVFFAIILTTICCFKGYFNHKYNENVGAKSIGVSTTSAVVISCTMILVTDYIITSLLL